MTVAWSEAEKSTEASTICPFSGVDTGIQRELDIALGPVSVNEFEMLVRNEWRRRLGPACYHRDHPRVLIRALAAYALAPESPVRNAVATQLVLWQLTSLGTCGLGRVAIKHEFQELVRAVRRVLLQVGFGPGPSTAVADQIARTVNDIVGWLEATSAENDAK